MPNAQFYFRGGDSNDRVSPSADNSYAQKGALYRGTNHMGRSVAFEPQRLYNFELQIVGLDKLYTADQPGTGNYNEGDTTGFNGNLMTEGYNNTEGFSNSEFIHFGSAAERILVACSSFSVPDTTFGMIEIPHYNNTTKYAGKVEFGDASLVVEQYLGAFTEQIMTTWARCVYDPKSQNIGFKHDYAKDLFIIEYDSKGGTPRVWKMENAWPNVLPGSDWDYNSSDRRQMTYTIKCDRCIPDYGIDTRSFSAVYSSKSDKTEILRTALNNTALSSDYLTANKWSWNAEAQQYLDANTGKTIPSYYGSSDNNYGDNS